MTINATAAILLLFYQLVAEGDGVDPAKLGGTIQNDILKEYVARGTYIYPPRPSMRLVTDTFSYCAEHLPAWNTISISGYHIREAGSTAVQEVAFTFANAIAYVQAAVALIVIEVDTSASGRPRRSTRMSSIESMATPTRPTSPRARASSESRPIWVGRSKATLRPVCPCDSR